MKILYIFCCTYYFFSDDSQLMVIEEMDEPIHEHVIVFSQKGTANNGFHRFRVPLRPSFQSVRIKFQSILPPNAFVTISNTKMIDNRYEEISCETDEADIKKNENFGFNIETTSFLPNFLTDEEIRNRIIAKPPLASFADVFKANPLPTITSFLPNQPQKLPLELPSLFISTLAPFVFSTSATPTLSSLLIPSFNPFKPMLESGLVPIVPLKDVPQRLTALQKTSDIEINKNKV